MDTLVQYFENIPSLHRTIILVGGLTFFLTLESIVPLFRFNYKKWRHAGINIFFTITTILVNFLLAFALIKASSWATENQFGMLQWINGNVWVQLILGLLVLDFISSWLIHWIEHKVPLLWKFHVIHHSDQQIDTTTANRHHPGESVFRLIFTVLAVIIVGAPIWLIFLYQSLSAMFSQFNHSNIAIPKWLDDALMWVFVTPNMHRVHHHYRLPYSDRNYGNIFSFWDRLLRTMVLADNKSLVYGIDTYMDRPEAEDIVTMLKIPFKEYRPQPQYDSEENLPV